MTKIMGHRGARDLWAENALEGFREVLQISVDGRGVSGVECDVHLTDAGEVVVIHDATLERTTTGTGPVTAVTPEARAAIALRGPDGTVTQNHLPLLDEALDVVLAHPSAIFFIEIKSDAAHHPYPGLAAKVVAILRARAVPAQRVCLLTFDLTVLSELHEIAPEYPRMLCIYKGNAETYGGLDALLTKIDTWVDYAAFHADYLAPRFDAVAARRAPDRITVWTPNTPTDLAAWIDRGVAYVHTDRPDIALGLPGAQ
ncbi:glycerophosphoryl diester phosphodiesterase [Ketogulonicigenium robustum]|uniref:Glycerophosphoryl diester phosphodiesterase n=1 Tax=Ketogulonicigenium robustum TaxID=92947 RepID=A0A1W6P2A5_9RHOB|nr:glycerophosphodiester phosphodiesterase family protein [Ketogulonicigenium robustum]ARO15616.1 glycerophosphoryl diester phosphodiesterase [Ketogulonicigenium robustum]